MSVYVWGVFSFSVTLRKGTYDIKGETLTYHTSYIYIYLQITDYKSVYKMSFHMRSLLHFYHYRVFVALLSTTVSSIYFLECVTRRDRSFSFPVMVETIAINCTYVRRRMNGMGWMTPTVNYCCGNIFSVSVPAVKRGEHLSG